MPRTFAAAPSPSGRATLQLSCEPLGPATLPALSKRITGALAHSTGRGPLHLGAAELGTDLSPRLAFQREPGRRVVVAARGANAPAGSVGALGSEYPPSCRLFCYKGVIPRRDAVITIERRDIGSFEEQTDAFESDEA